MSVIRWLSEIRWLSVYVVRGPVGVATAHAYIHRDDVRHAVGTSHMWREAHRRGPGNGGGAVDHLHRQDLGECVERRHDEDERDETCAE